MIEEIFQDRLAAKLKSERQEDGMKFPLVIILSIVGVVFQLITCLNSQGVRMGMNQSRIARAIRQKTDLGFIDSRKVAAKILEVAKESTDEELEAIISEARA